ncbi:hypothetical protein KAR91_82960 [Candidatus Pacearchaeota archaeon]|nr:hypothetical protein [Candidatus Pacearchaeota archaeon]
MSDIAAVFDDEVVEEVTEEVSQAEEVNETAKESEKVEEAPEVESKDEPKEPEKAEPTSEEAEKENWTFQAVKDERRKRQELEKQLEELKAGQNNPEPKELPDIFENQEGFVNDLREQMRVETRQQIIQNQRDRMIEFKSDYEEKEAAFIEFGKNNPTLLAEANTAANPAKFAYEQGAKILEYKQMQDVDGMKAKLRAEIEAEVRSEFESKQSSIDKKAQNLSPSLAGARGTAETEESVPENPGDLF